MNRRRFLYNAGVTVWLPVLESLVPAQVFAQSMTRSKFVMVFSPSGMLMPGGGNGNWTFEGALRPLVDAGLRNNAMIVRGLQGQGDTDPHWLNTAGFLSCKPIQLASDRPTVCGKTFDQLVADKTTTTLRSLHVGFKAMNRDFSADHGSYSDRYLDTIAFRADNRPIGNIYSPRVLFDSVYGGSQAGARHIKAQNTRRQSILDAVLGDLKSLQRGIASSDRPKLEAYIDGVREVEKKIAAAAQSVAACTAAGAAPAAGLGYVQHIQIMQEIVAHAFQCGLISAATIMYDDGVGDQFLLHPGTEHDHHGYAHHGNEAGAMAKLNTINLQHGSLFAQFVNSMKNRGVLDSSIIMWGSNMSDGNTHNTNNLPIVIAGGGAGLKWGQELNGGGNLIPKANLFVELGEVLGLNLTSFGSGPSASTSARIGIQS